MDIDGVFHSIHGTGKIMEHQNLSKKNGGI